LISNGAEVTLAQVLRDVNERDARDQDRAEAPLRAAPDAIEIDTSDLSIDAALKRAIVAVAQNRQPQKPL
jgi:cytidylate kinase